MNVQWRKESQAVLYQMVADVIGREPLSFIIVRVIGQPDHRLFCGQRWGQGFN